MPSESKVTVEGDLTVEWSVASASGLLCVERAEEVDEVAYESGRFAVLVIVVVIYRTRV